jgi:hypothetical protein
MADRWHVKGCTNIIVMAFPCRDEVRRGKERVGIIENFPHPSSPPLPLSSHLPGIVVALLHILPDPAPPSSHLLRPPPPQAPISIHLRPPPSPISHLFGPPLVPALTSVRERLPDPFSSDPHRRQLLLGSPPPPPAPACSERGWGICGAGGVCV